MAYRQSWKLLNCSTLAGFKEWAMEISAALAAAGWQRTADTGQVDWNSLVAVPAYNAHVYEVWVSTDAISATFPIYIKMEYAQSQSNNAPFMYITCGTGTDGAGTITGNATARCGYNNVTNTISATTRYEIDTAWYGSGSSFAFLLGRDLGGGYYPRLFALERSHAADGSDTDEYFTVLHMGANLMTQVSVFKSGSAAPTGPVETWAVNTLMPSGRGVGESMLSPGNLVHVSPVYPLVGRLGNPMTLLLCGSAVDFGEGVVVNTTLYGATHNYLMSKANGFICNCIPWNGSSSNIYRCYGLRWDAGA